MKRAAAILLTLLFLSGCASYTFQRGQEPYHKGYVAARDDFLIPEYTLGKDNTVPSDLALAKERFKQRKGIVEYYYKKMGSIENRFKMAFWDPVIFFLKMFTGVFRLPCVAISDYRYEHDPHYREKKRTMQDKQDLEEEVRIKKLKGELNKYLEEELRKENP
jgi:hypothetical protein